MSVTLSGTFLNPDGSNIGVGTLILTLSQSAVETGTGWVVPSVVRVPLTNGAIPGATTVLGNDALTPAGTVYSASILTSVGFSWNLGSFSITGSSFNFNDAVPVSQNLIFPPTTLAIKPAAADGIQFVSANGNDSNDGLSWGTAKATVQAAITAAGTNGIVFVGPDVSTSQVITGNGNNVTILDFRPNNNGAIGVWHGMASMALPGYVYPMGNDFPITVGGPADIVPTNVKVATTTTASIVVGVNTDVLVGSTANLSTATGVPLWIGRGTANSEAVNSGSWSIVDATHLTFTAAKAHSGTTDIEQIGQFRLEGADLTIGGTQTPSQSPDTPMIIQDKNLNPFMYFPVNMSASAPLGNVMIENGLIFLPANSPIPPTSWNHLSITPGGNGEFGNTGQSGNQLGFTGPFYSQSANVAASGIVRLATTDTIAWRNNANSGDVALSKNTSDQLTAGAMALTGEFACNGATPVAATTGYGTPTGNALTASFAASTITLPELAAELAQLILDLKAAGLIKA